MPTLVDMCRYYDVLPIDDFKSFKSLCKKGHRAGLKCHSSNTCPDYEKGIALSLEEVKEKYSLQ